MNGLCRHLVAGVMSVAVTYTVCFIVLIRSVSVHAESSVDRLTDDQAEIARGRYLVRTTGCNDCHTPGYTRTAGAVDESKWLTGDSLGFQGPWGTTYPANLRQLMQGMSVDTWKEYARRPTRPPMPWFALRDMSDEDLAAIYAFVRSLGPSTDKVPAYAPPGERVMTAVVRFPDVG